MKVNPITQKRAKTLLNIFFRSRHKVGVLMFKMPDRRWKILNFSSRTTLEDVANYHHAVMAYLGMHLTVKKKKRKARR